MSCRVFFLLCAVGNVCAAGRNHALPLPCSVDNVTAVLCRLGAALALKKINFQKR